MKNNYIQFVISCVFICLTTHVYGEVVEYPFRERALRSDLIVEGVVEKQTENKHFWNRKKLHSYRKKNIVRISNVYKGNIAQGDNITIFSHMNFVCDTSSKLAEGRRYLLMLKKHKSGFADVNYGRGIWEIVTDESGKQVVVSDSWLKTNGESYEQFKSNIALALSELTVELIGPKKLLIGERPNLQIEITNVSDKPVEFVRPLDGSWYHWRYPYMSVEIYDENSKSLSINLGGRCGNMNPIVLEDIKRLNPGEKKVFSVGWPFSGVDFNKPGKYSIIFSYDLRAPDIDAWVIAGRASKGETNSKITHLIERVPKLILTSKPLEVKINSVTKN